MQTILNWTVRYFVAVQTRFYIWTENIFCIAVNILLILIEIITRYYKCEVDISLEIIFSKEEDI